MNWSFQVLPFISHASGRIQVWIADSLKGAGLLLTQYPFDVKGKLLREILGGVQNADFSGPEKPQIFQSILYWKPGYLAWARFEISISNGSWKKDNEQNNLILMM